MRMAAASFTGMELPAGIWEEILFPARVKKYREALLDGFLAQGEYFWQMSEGGKLKLFPGEQIDWDCDPEVPWELLTEKERLVAEALLKRGASFAQALSGVLSGAAPAYTQYTQDTLDILFSLMEKGVVRADSFVPVRQWMNREKMKNAPARQRVGARVKALQAGRWDLVRPLRPCPLQEQMDRCFDRFFILCRETAAACQLSWQEALALLRVQEYTGQVRRGYFVKGLSGAQFIRRQDFESVTAALGRPGRIEMLWLNAADPGQIYGRVLTHEPGRAFVNVPGTAVCFLAGEAVGVFERQGKTLKVFDPQSLGAGRMEEALKLFAQDFRDKRIFAGKKRIVVKEFPAEAEAALEKSGFIREMQDYVLYR